MEIVISIFSCVILLAVISVLWVRGIDYMDKNHPNYKGHDLFDEGEEEENLDEDEKINSKD